MIPTQITNPKVADAAAPWRRYAGVSVLYDNPGTAIPPALVRLDGIPVVHPTEQELYDLLAASRDERIGEELAARAFWPLPRETFHVTVCDGMDQTKLGLLPAADRGDIDAFLEGLPDTLLHPPVQLRPLFDAPLATSATLRPVTFVVADLVIWGHVLAARLRASGVRSKAAFAGTVAARDELVGSLHRTLNKDTQSWRPHVSLGYFANLDDAEAASRALPALRTGFLDALGTAAITFRSAGVYGFSDMVTFIRAPSR